MRRWLVMVSWVWFGVVVSGCDEGGESPKVAVRESAKAPVRAGDREKEPVAVIVTQNGPVGTRTAAWERVEVETFVYPTRDRWSSEVTWVGKLRLPWDPETLVPPTSWVLRRTLGADGAVLSDYAAALDADPIGVGHGVTGYDILKRQGFVLRAPDPSGRGAAAAVEVAGPTVSEFEVTAPDLTYDPARIAKLEVSGVLVAVTERSIYRFTSAPVNGSVWITEGVSLTTTGLSTGRATRHFTFDGQVEGAAVTLLAGRVFLPTRVEVGGLPEGWRVGQVMVVPSNRGDDSGFALNVTVSGSGGESPGPDVLQLELEAITAAEARRAVVELTDLPKLYPTRNP